MTSLRWRKLGKIFDPADHRLAVGGAGFAQSPQALVLDGCVRIYFSTRSRDANGKFLSQVAFADFAADLRTVLRVADHEVIPLGGLGCFDEHGIFPFHVTREGGRVAAYPTGWSRRVSVSVETAIGLAFSDDNGLTFERVGPGPVLGPSAQEPCLVGDGFVRLIDGVFHMWYIFGTGWRRFAPGEPPDRTYKIGHATSPDGETWTKEEGRRIIPDRLGEFESQALPTVVTRAGRHHMFFCYRHSSDFRKNKDRGYRLGHAYSDDLREWFRDDESAPAGTPGEWDSDMQCYPHAFEFNGRTYLLYNGNEFGRNGFGLAVLEAAGDRLPPPVAGRASPEEIAAHLRRCDAGFVPPLSVRVDLDAYAAKLAERANRLEIWDHGRLVGLAAYYVDQASGVAFLSNLSVDPSCRGRRLGRDLLHEAVTRAEALGATCMELEVAEGNQAAVGLYAAAGFQARSVAMGVVRMHLTLPTPGQ
jgi:ribosomal protein S18 acetylase RimI-like enzyme